MSAHAILTGLQLHTPFHYEQTTDPGAVGAGLYWLNTSTFAINRRNDSNTAWNTVAGPVAGATGATGAPGIVAVSIQGGQPYINVQDQKLSGTAGGTFTQGAWQTRALTTVTNNDQNLAVLNPTTNGILLTAGTWRATISCPASGAVGLHKARLRDLTTGGVLLYGTSEQTAASQTSRAFISGTFPLNSARSVVVEHQCAATVSTSGFGAAASFAGAPEIYTVVELWLVGGPPPFFGDTRLTENPNAFNAMWAARRNATRTSTQSGFIS